MFACLFNLFKEVFQKKLSSPQIFFHSHRHSHRHSQVIVIVIVL